MTKAAQAAVAEAMRVKSEAVESSRSPQARSHDDVLLPDGVCRSCGSCPVRQLGPCCVFDSAATPLFDVQTVERKARPQR